MSSLQNRTVVSFRPAHQSEGFVTKLKAIGATVYEIPLLKIVPGNTAALKDAADQLTEYDWIIFTSANGVDAFSKFVDLSAASTPKIAVIGPATKEKVESVAGRVTAMPDSYIAEEIVPMLGDVKGKKILLPRAKQARNILPQELKKLGATVNVIEAYDVEPDKTSLELIEKIKHTPDFLTFTSSSSVNAAIELLTEAGCIDWLNNSKRVAIGPITDQTLVLSGFSPNLVANEYTASGIVKCIKDYVENTDA